ncbi:hypothetical protein C0J52_05781 [Blattella germanica]|nr:hypothetical protein C0J52_05781 [Blattella germanica]
MSFYDFINRILGIHGKRQDTLPPSREDNRPGRPHPDEFRKPIWNWDDDDDDDEDDFRTRPPSSPFGDQITPPMLPEGPQKEGSLREQYLKPGFDTPSSDWSKGNSREDKDLDDKISAGELDNILGSKPSLEADDSHRSLVPAVPGMQSRIFGKSVTSKTIRKPDGSLEIHRTVRDSQGNEETTVTRQMGDQSYTVTIHTDPSGTEERTENLYNLQEEDLDNFKKKWFDQEQHSRRDPLAEGSSKPHNWFPFDKFFRW